MSTGTSVVPWRTPWVKTLFLGNKQGQIAWSEIEGEASFRDYRLDYCPRARRARPD